jgi:hypothetical protein
MEWKWTPNNNEPYTKSLRQPKQNNYNDESHLFRDQREKPPDFSELAYSHSLSSHETNGWETDSFLQNQSQNIMLEQQFKNVNKREDNIHRMAEREMIAQIGQNPFLDDNDYVKNVVARDLFLKPMNTNSDVERKKGDYE